jgi:hypothetical protein
MTANEQLLQAAYAGNIQDINAAIAAGADQEHKNQALTILVGGHNKWSSNRHDAILNVLAKGAVFEEKNLSRYSSVLDSLMGSLANDPTVALVQELAKAQQKKGNLTGIEIQINPQRGACMWAMSQDHNSNEPFKVRTIGNAQAHTNAIVRQ